MLNLDTHILLFAIAGSLTAAEERLLTGNEWSMSAICLWELAKLAQLRRVEVDLETPAFTRLLSRLQIWPLTPDVCRAIPRLDFRGDPADEIIAATSLVHRVPLLTRDRVIRGSRIVPFA